MNTEPSETMLNDAEGRELVQAIHDRQAQRRELGRLILGRTATSAVEAILAAGYRKPQQITTADELLNLTEGSVVIDSEGDVSQKRGGLWCGYETAPINSNKLARMASPFTVLQVGATK